MEEEINKLKNEIDLLSKDYEDLLNENTKIEETSFEYSKLKDSDDIEKVIFLWRIVKDENLKKYLERCLITIGRI